MIFRKSSLVKDVDALTVAVDAQDAARSEAAFNAVLGSIRTAKDKELVAAGPRLAALVERFPPEPRGMLAVLTGACVERGADPVACATPLLTAALTTLHDAARFREQWAAVSDGDEDPLELTLSGSEAASVVERLGGYATPGVRTAVAAWANLHDWERAAVAMLSHSPVRRALNQNQRSDLIAATKELGGADMLRCLYYSLLVLDDEPLVALHRESGIGYALRLTGIGDNFQLHTLLGDVLINGGHVPGQGPTAKAADLCRDKNVAVEHRPVTVGSFNLVAPDGSWIWNEGTPRDIPVVDGVRLLVLDKAPYQRSWPAGRFFPNMVADLRLERVLAPDETAQYFRHVKPLGNEPRRA
ncbi:hypothetical protein ABIA33_000566 [Streptacidiphilus sp. MAP12-16]|uniref:hypothetical protein n=1 Tax=Streptacidiphilus sp. MAP12-16 TaxID=3156300 RepID=UPI00351729F7